MAAALSRRRTAGQVSCRLVFSISFSMPTCVMGLYGGLLSCFVLSLLSASSIIGSPLQVGIADQMIAQVRLNLLQVANTRQNLSYVTSSHILTGNNQLGTGHSCRSFDGTFLGVVIRVLFHRIPSTHTAERIIECVRCSANCI